MLKGVVKHPPHSHFHQLGTMGCSLFMYIVRVESEYSQQHCPLSPTPCSFSLFFPTSMWGDIFNQCCPSCSISILITHQTLLPQILFRAMNRSPFSSSCTSGTFHIRIQYHLTNIAIFPMHYMSIPLQLLFLYLSDILVTFIVPLIFAFLILSTLVIPQDRLK